MGAAIIFVDRKVELEQLEKEWQRDGSSFTVIYGRMRVGKTQLIKKFLSGKDGIYYPASEEADVIQRRHFQELNPILKSNDVFSWDTFNT